MGSAEKSDRQSVELHACIACTVPAAMYGHSSQIKVNRQVPQSVMNSWSYVCADAKGGSGPKGRLHENAGSPFQLLVRSFGKLGG